MIRSRSECRVDRFATSGRDTDYIDVLYRTEQLGQRIPHQRVVIGDENLDHRTGTVTVTTVPSPGALVTARRPAA